jgi:hypothetical protein
MGGYRHQKLSRMCTDFLALRLTGPKKVGKRSSTTRPAKASHRPRRRLRGGRHRSTPFSAASDAGRRGAVPKSGLELLKALLAGFLGVPSLSLPYHMLLYAHASNAGEKAGSSPSSSS